jgi:hypothetical protein
MTRARIIHTRCMCEDCAAQGASDGLTAWREKAEALEERVTTLVNEECGMQPVQSADDLMTVLERHLFEQRRQLAEIDEGLTLIVAGAPTSVCTFCRFVGPNDPETIKAHMLACEKHPMRVLTAEVERLGHLFEERAACVVAVTRERDVAEAEIERAQKARLRLNAILNCDGIEWGGLVHLVEALESERLDLIQRVGAADAAAEELRDQIDDWREVTGGVCQTPSDLGDVLQREAGVSIGIALELKRLRELEASLLDCFRSYPIAMGAGVAKNDRLRAAVEVCRAARGEACDGEGGRHEDPEKGSR